MHLFQTKKMIEAITPFATEVMSALKELGTPQALERFDAVHAVQLQLLKLGLDHEKSRSNILRFALRVANAESRVHDLSRAALTVANEADDEETVFELLDRGDPLGLGADVLRLLTGSTGAPRMVGDMLQKLHSECESLTVQLRAEKAKEKQLQVAIRSAALTFDSKVTAGSSFLTLSGINILRRRYRRQRSADAAPTLEARPATLAPGETAPSATNRLQ